MDPLSGTDLRLRIDSPQPDTILYPRDNAHGASASCGVCFPVKIGPHLPIPGWKAELT